MKRNILVILLSLFTGIGFAQLDRSQVPKPQPNPEIKIDIPPVEIYDNGLKVIVVENHKLPKVSFQLYVDYPILPEGDKAGLSSIFSQMLEAGSASIPKDEFDQKIDYIGATLITSSRGFYASSLKKHTPQLLELLSELVLNPAFPEEEFARIKKQEKSGIIANASDANFIAGTIADLVNYGKEHPYGEVTTEKSIENITLDDIKNHYDKNFKANEAYLVIVGDVSAEEAKGYVEKYFLKWEKGGATKQRAYQVPDYPSGNVYFVNRPGAVQSVVNITQTIQLQPGHEDAIKVRLLNHILGGGSFSARLMSNLREDKAYTYGCYSQMNSDELTGYFVASGSFRNEVTDSAIVQILDEITMITNEVVTDKELELAKNSITGSFARSLESPQTVARFALNTAKYNLPADYYQTYLQKLEKITKEDLLAVAKKYLAPEKLSIVVVGNEEIVSNLEQFDDEGGITRLDAFGEPEAQLAPVPKDVTAETVINTYSMKCMTISDRSEEAKRMKKIGFIRTTYKGDVEEMGATIYITNYRGTPNKTASTVKASQGGPAMTVQKEWFNGEKGGTFTMGAPKTKYEGDDLEKKKAPNFPFSQYHYFTNDKYEVQLLGIAEVDGNEYYKVKVSTVGDDDFSFEYYNIETGLLDMEESFFTDDEGQSQSTTIKYSDYTDIGGILVPGTMQMQMGDQMITLTLDSYDIKKKPKSAVFDGVFK